MDFNKNESRFIRRWTVATVVGFTLGSPFTLGVIVLHGMGGGFENVSTYIKFGTLAGLILGTLIGFCQKLTLIGQASRLNWWIRASILGGTLGGFILGGLLKLSGKMNSDLIFLVILAMPGIIIGIAQSFVLMKSFKKAPLWGCISVNIIAWTVTQHVLFSGILSSQLYPGPTLLTLLFSGAILGLITGIYLTWLLSNFKKE
ncbi:MAG: hypothetical protein GDA44_15015 [Prochloron sp. SP5CPC1]|nr:hypothetical protein [Candidatus Paraprochloron terpiosi SP5CPC1]